MLVNLDKFNFFYWLEGCARGSNLRNTVWGEVVNCYIQHMDDKFRDCIWWWLRRDLYDIYNKPYSSGSYNEGREDFNHCLAALHRNNYAWITWINPNNKRNKKASYGKTLCYRYNGTWYVENSFRLFIPQEWIKSVDKVVQSDNEAVELSHREWWEGANYDNC